MMARAIKYSKEIRVTIEKFDAVNEFYSLLIEHKDLFGNWYVASYSGNKYEDSIETAIEKLNELMKEGETDGH